jgi:hypothetical protein
MAKTAQTEKDKKDAEKKYWNHRAPVEVEEAPADPEGSENATAGVRAAIGKATYGASLKPKKKK